MIFRPVPVPFRQEARFSVQSMADYGRPVKIHIAFMITDPFDSVDRVFRMEKGEHAAGEGNVYIIIDLTEQGMEFLFCRTL